ncbi:RNA methyltransferase, putative [Plasmodium gallinaceum]|uniref:RNA methyltransferase, putative n=1 Tax=Plasmodium gallinaceum TaxID=5849 RepID=A0A1J1GKX6_PLAGA|nr:RNA methyltransferase, putative [Plasmodium gallinaceum]CRG93025.1 RNA methyltransferase, putative [Plasmodium gallinaceum]
MFLFANISKKYVTNRNFISEFFLMFERNVSLIHKNLIKTNGKNFLSVIHNNQNEIIHDENLKPFWLNLNGKEKNKLNHYAKQGDKEKEDSEFLNISKRSKMMKYIIRLRKKKNFRKKMNEFFVKNSKTILYMSNNKNLLFEAVLSSNKDLLQHFRGKCKKLYYVNYDILNYIFYDSVNVMKEKNDSVAILKIPNVVNKIKNIKFLLAFDRIRYAYNLGKILNVAYSMNIDYLFYLHNTVDPFNSKVIEITNGSHLNIPYMYGSYKDLKDLCSENNLVPIVAHINGLNPHNILKESNKNGICLILGNESTGPHPDTLKFAKPISLPMHEMTNSLNVSVAASILIHYIKNML